MAIKFQDGLIGSEQISFEMIVCYCCHIPFMVTAKHRAKLQETCEGFYCPSGHYQAYTVSTCKKIENKLKAELAEKERQLEQNIEWTNNILMEKYDLQKKLYQSRLKECPHCNKKYINLERHILKHHG